MGRLARRRRGRPASGGAHRPARDALRPRRPPPPHRRPRRVSALKNLFEGRCTPGRWVRAPDPGFGPGDGDLGAAVERASGAAVAEALRRHGTDAERRHVAAIEADPRRGAYAFAEEDAGSDASAIAAAWDGASVTGRKALVANAATAGLFLVLARRGGRADARLTAVAVEAGRRVAIGPARRSVVGIDLHDVEFDAAPAGLLGAEGEGWRVAESALGAGRVALAVAAVGAARAGIDLIRAATARVRYGGPLGAHESVADAVEEAGDDLFAMEAVAADAAARLAGGDAALEAACAKVWNVEALVRIADTAARLAGGAAALEASPHAGLAARARALDPVFGPNDVIRAYVALSGVEAVRSYLRATDEALRSAWGFVSVLPWYALRRARLAFGVPRLADAPRALREAASRVEEAAGILAYRAFDLAFRRRGLLRRAPRLQQRLGQIACETYAAACAVARADAETEGVAWRIATRALERVARESRRLEEALVVAEEAEG